MNTLESRQSGAVEEEGSGQLRLEQKTTDPAILDALRLMELKALKVVTGGKASSAD
ncbi:MAG: hypothetical protein AAB606_01950 [Patescibacteria group bacterium]